MIARTSSGHAKIPGLVRVPRVSVRSTTRGREGKEGWVLIRTFFWPKILTVPFLASIRLADGASQKVFFVTDLGRPWPFTSGQVCIFSFF